MTTTRDNINISFLRSASRKLATDIDNDSFRLPYSAGFALFLSLAVVVGIITIAVLMYQAWQSASLSSGEQQQESSLQTWESSDIKKTKLRRVVYAALLLVSTACLAWLCAHTPYERVYEEPPYFSFLGILISFIAMLVALWKLCRQTPKPGLLTAVFGLSTCFLVVPGLVLLALYCHHMESADRYTYHGPMRIIGYSVDSLRIGNANENSDYTRFYGEVQVGWGMQWGCPDHPTKWCETHVKLLECEYCELGGMGCHSGGRSDARMCIRDKYNIAYWEDTVGFPETEYDRTELPDEDPNWPYDEFFGDCSSCDALETEALEGKIDYAKKVKWTGAGIAIAGAALYMTLPALLWCKTYRE